MYKSTFAKYFTAFVLILGISIIMLSSIFAALIREYTADDSDERLRKTSAAVADILRKTAVETLTPIEAMNLLYELKQKL